LDTTDQIALLIERFGFLLVFFGVMLGSAGIPIPGQIILLVSGVLAQQGYLDLGGALVCGIMGAVVGAQIGYWVGRKRGRSVVERWGHYVLITPERLTRAEGLFSRHGGKTLVFVRFIPGLRVFGALMAGMSGIGRSTFLFYNVLGGVFWTIVIMVLVGYFLVGYLLIGYLLIG